MGSAEIDWGLGELKKISGSGERSSPAKQLKAELVPMGNYVKENVYQSQKKNGHAPELKRYGERKE